MSEKKVVSITASKSWQAKGMWRLQFSAIFWHLFLFLLPVYAVWLGLFVQQQAWFALILWSMVAIFFLFFVGTESLALKTREPRRWPFQRSIQNSASLLRRLARGRTTSDNGSIFGNYANDGKAHWAQDDDDGITIEDYLKQRKGHAPKKAGFDWNWQQDRHDESESYLVLQREPGLEPLHKYFRVNWQQAWQTAFPHAERRGRLALFWTSALWLPVSYWLLYSANADALQRGGFVRYGQPAWGSLYALLLLANLALPILANQVGRKLQHSLSDTVSRLTICLSILLELSYSLAALLITWPFIGSPAPSLAAWLLVVVGLYLRLDLRRSMPQSLPLLLFRQLGCLSASLGLLLYLSPASNLFS